MANGDDTLEYCCIIQACCGGDDDHKRIETLAGVIKKQIGKPGPYTSHEVAAAIVEHFDIVPRSYGLGAMITRIAQLARRFPYTG